MTSARFRDVDEEILAEKAREAFMLADWILAHAAFDDPLRDAAAVARSAFLSGLRVTPMSRIDQPRTMLEAATPHGDEALEQCERVSDVERQRLDRLRACAFDEETGPAAERHALVWYVVLSARETVDELKSDPRFAADVEKLASQSDGEIEPETAPACLFASVEKARLAYFTMTRKDLDSELFARAVIASAQYYLRGEGPGAVPNGLMSHITTMEDLIAAAELPKPTPKALRDTLRAAYAAYADLSARRGGWRPFVRLAAADEARDAENKSYVGDVQLSAAAGPVDQNACKPVVT